MEDKVRRRWRADFSCIIIMISSIVTQHVTGERKFSIEKNCERRTEFTTTIFGLAYR
jgi:hypothetical protein